MREWAIIGYVIDTVVILSEKGKDCHLYQVSIVCYNLTTVNLYLWTYLRGAERTSVRRKLRKYQEKGSCPLRCWLPTQRDHPRSVTYSTKYNPEKHVNVVLNLHWSIVNGYMFNIHKPVFVVKQHMANVAPLHTLTKHG